MADVRTVAMVTGGNRGLGLEAVRRMAGKGWRVFLAARDSERGMHAADMLAGEGLDIEFVELDVTSDESVAAAVKAIAGRVDHLDVLVNNAGVGGPLLDPADMDADMLRALYEVNVFGQVRVTHALLPLLRESQHPRIVIVSSGLASLTHSSDSARPEFGFLSVSDSLCLSVFQ